MLAVISLASHPFGRKPRPPGETFTRARRWQRRQKTTSSADPEVNEANIPLTLISQEFVEKWGENQQRKRRDTGDISRAQLMTAYNEMRPSGPLVRWASKALEDVRFQLCLKGLQSQPFAFLPHAHSQGGSSVSCPWRQRVRSGSPL